MSGEITKPSGGRKPPENLSAIGALLRGLTPPRLHFLLVVLSLVFGPSSFAFAHRLEAEAIVRPFGTIQVETWFETGDSPKAAKVSVFAADGQRLTEGRCDERGIFVFAYAGNKPLRVVVDAGAGHRAEAMVSTAMLTRPIVCTAVACLTPPPSLIAAPLLVPVKITNSPVPQPLVERNTAMPLGRLALGVGLLLAVATVVLIHQRLRRTVQAPTS